MRVIVALVVATISFSLSGCSRPPQAEHPKLVRSKWVVPQSRRHVPKFTEASAAKTLTKTSRHISKRPKKLKTHLAKPDRPETATASPDMGPPLPPRRPEPPATDAVSPPPLPPRKGDETPTGPADTHAHAVRADGKFMAAKEKAQREGVQSLTSEDIRGLSQEQIKELRGY